MMRRWTLGAIVAVNCVILGAFLYDYLQFKSDSRKKWELESWSDSYEKYRSSGDFITDKIGVIQFLERGYSVNLTSAEYVDEGLRLGGWLGNPLNLDLSSLTLNVQAAEEMNPFFPFFSTPRDSALSWTRPKVIGAGQTLIQSLPSGRSVYFTITIPNVKQDPRGIDLQVSFSGERYTYPQF